MKKQRDFEGRTKRKERRQLERLRAKRKKYRKTEIWKKLSFWLPIAGILIIVGFIVGWSLLAKGEVSFEEAIKKPELREKYIEKIVKKIGQPEYVGEITYIDNPEEFEVIKREYGRLPDPKEAMVSTGKLFPEHPEERKARILIFPFAFSGKLIKSEEDFLSTLLHEYRHQKVTQEGKFGQIEFSSFQTKEGKLNEELLEDIAELDAIRIELSSFRKLSPSYWKNQFICYLVHYTNIWDHGKGMDPEFIKFLKVEFFGPWLLESPDLIRKIRMGKAVWYFKNPKTGREYYLPKEVIEKYSQSGKG